MHLLYIGNDTNLLSSLEDQKIRIDQVRNSIQAKEWLDKGQVPDAILCESDLPGSTASYFYTYYKKHFDPKRSVPFIALGNEEKKMEMNQALKTGMDDYYSKPVDPVQILARISFLNRLKTRADTPNLTHVNEEILKKYRTYKVPFFKRTFDIILSLTGILFFSPVLLISILAIISESKGSFFYTSKRVGTGYKIFKFYKLRSMYIDADKSIEKLSDLNQYRQGKTGNTPDGFTGKKEATDDKFLIYDDTIIAEKTYLKQKKERQQTTFVKFENDPRITKTGRIIRKLSIDELPQLINVLKGDMSIVGNRPLPLYEAELLTTDDWIERFLGPAGITGLWQVEARGKTKKMSPEERKELDNKYSKIAQSPYSFIIDIWIILRTIPAVFQKENV